MITPKISFSWLAFLPYCYLSLLAPEVVWGAGANPPADPGQPAPGNDQSNNSSGKSTTATNDKTNYQGDRVSFSRDIIVQVEAADQTVLKTVCLPRKWLLRGGDAYSANGAKSSDSSAGTPETGTRFTLLKAPTGKDIDAEACKQDLPSPLPTNFDQTGDLVHTQSVIRVTTQQLQDSPPDRLGLAYGVLSVPFKYHLTGAKDFTGSASIGSYIGYRTDNQGYGYGTTFMAFIGASNISVPASTPSGTGTNTQSSATSTHSLFGVSYGVGAVATIKGSFQIGVVIGADRVSNSENYQYNGKGWLALEIGYDFVQ